MGQNSGGIVLGGVNEVEVGGTEEGKGIEVEEEETENKKNEGKKYI